MKKINGISTETVDSILRSLGTGTKKTKIIMPYVSDSQVDTHLSILLNRGYVKYERETGHYKITPSGAEFVETIAKLREMVGEPRKDFYQ